MARKTFNVAAEFPEFTHANGRKTIAQINNSLEYNRVRYEGAYKWWTLILGQSDQTFMAMTVASAVLNHCHWIGSGAGFNPGATSTSRNNVENIPGGEYLVNVGITVLQGRFKGGGTSIGMNGNASTQFVYDHAGWIDPRPIRSVIISANWGTSQYQESLYLSDFRVTGNAPHWLDKSYTQHGIALRMLGETAVLDRVYVETCNGHGVWINGAGPGKIIHLTTFDNNLAGLYVTNTNDGSTNGNSLGKLQVDHVSGDNNAWVVLNQRGGSMLIGYLKNEDGLSAQRGRPAKDQVSYEGHGWINTLILSLDDAVKGPSGPTIVLNSIANKSKFTVMHYASVAANNNPNEGRSALIADVRAKKAWRAPAQDDQDLRVMEIHWTGHGTVSSLSCSEPMVEIPFNGTTRLGIASSYTGYDYANALPVWDPSGGVVTPPVPPTPPVDPPVPPVEPPVPPVEPPPTGSTIAVLNNYANLTDKNRSVPVSWKGVKRFRFTNLTVVSTPNFQRLAYASASDTSGLRVQTNGVWKIGSANCPGTPAAFVPGTYASAEIVLPTPQDFLFFLANKSNGTAWLFSADKIEVLNA